MWNTVYNCCNKFLDVWNPELPPRVGNCAVACKFFRCYTSRANYEGKLRADRLTSMATKSKRHAERGTACVCTHGGSLILLSAYNTQLSPGWTETQHLPWRIRPIPRLVFHRRRLVTSLGDGGEADSRTRVRLRVKMTVYSLWGTSPPPFYVLTETTEISDVLKLTRTRNRHFYRDSLRSSD